MSKPNLRRFRLARPRSFEAPALSSREAFPRLLALFLLLASLYLLLHLPLPLLYLLLHLRPPLLYLLLYLRPSFLYLLFYLLPPFLYLFFRLLLYVLLHSASARRAQRRDQHSRDKYGDSSLHAFPPSQ